MPSLVQYQERCLACKKPVPLISQDSLLEQLKEDNKRGYQANPDTWKVAVKWRVCGDDVSRMKSNI